MSTITPRRLSGSVGTKHLSGETADRDVCGNLRSGGPLGIQGATGIQGIQGVTGVGAQGETGIQGVTGIEGVTGVGYIGSDGVTGIQGVTGLMGVTGPSGQGGTGGTDLYTNATPVPVTIGGIASGSTFLNQTMQQMWDALLYPYQTPTFTSFLISGYSSPLEVGDTIPASITFTWGTTNPSNIQTNSVEIDDVTLATTLDAGIANSGSDAVTMAFPITNNVPASHVFRIQAVNSLSQIFNRTLTMNWYWLKYWGNSSNTTLSEANIKALSGSVLSNSYAGSYATAATGYKFLCVPDGAGHITSVTDPSTGFPVAMVDVSLDANYSNVDAGGFYYMLVSVTNVNGQTVNYRVYRTYNVLGGALTMVVV
jgi:hypothetical protein